MWHTRLMTAHPPVQCITYRLLLPLPVLSLTTHLSWGLGKPLRHVDNWIPVNFVVCIPVVLCILVRRAYTCSSRVYPLWHIYPFWRVYMLLCVYPSDVHISMIRLVYTYYGMCTHCCLHTHSMCVYLIAIFEVVVILRIDPLEQAIFVPTQC